MSTLLEELSAKARTLSREERARLAEDLLDSLEGASESPDDAQAAWEQEVQRRVEEVRCGSARLVPADQVFAETRRIYQR